MIDDWEDNTQDDDAPENSAMLGCARLYGTSYHAIAIRVVGGFSKEGEPAEQQALDPSFQEELDALYGVNGDGPFCLTQIPGYEGDYVIAIIPYAT